MKLGDIIFQDLPKIPIWIFRLVSLISEAQGGIGPDHCGICTGFFLGIPLITEAFVFGVWTIPLPLFWIRWPFGVKTRSWSNQSIVSNMIQCCVAKEGMPYNIYYSDSDNAYYCTSLIAKAFAFAAGHSISCTKTVKEVELSDPPAVNQYQEILGALPDPNSSIWLPIDLLNAKELNA